MNELIEIFAGSPIDAEMVRSLLNDSEIENYLRDEFLGTIAPWQVSSGGAGAVKVLINKEDYQKAKLIIEKFEQSKRE